MIETGIPKLDDYLGGGIPEKKSLLFSIAPEVEESNLAIHVLHHNLQRGKRCIYVVSQSSSKQLAHSFREFGWDFEEYSDLLTVVDGYSRLIGTPSDEKFVILEPHDILSYEDVVDELLEAQPGPAVVSFDSLSNIMDLCGERETLQGISRINERISDKNGVAVYNFTSWPYKESILYRIQRLFDAIVEIDAVTGETYSGQKYHLVKIGWNGQASKSVLFKVYRPGGIRIYVPKVMVMGPFRSGKTSFMKALCDRHTSVDRMGSTIAVEHGTIDRPAYRAEVFGVPGQERFLPLVQKMKGVASGALLVIDATQPEQIPEAKKMAAELSEQHIPYVVAANKCDAPGAMGEEEIRRRMDAPETPVVPTAATTGEGVFKAFEMLVEEIIGGESHAG